MAGMNASDTWAREATSLAIANWGCAKRAALTMACSRRGCWLGPLRQKPRGAATWTQEIRAQAGQGLGGLHAHVWSGCGGASAWTLRTSTRGPRTSSLSRVSQSGTMGSISVSIHTRKS